MLPRLIETDDYYQCIENKKTHCRAVAKLFPQNETNGLWKEVLKLEANHYLLDRTSLQRGLCIQNYENPEEQCKLLIDMEVKRYNFTAEIINVTCSNGEIPKTMVDQILLLAAIFLCILIITATIMDKKLAKMEGIYAKVLSTFSIFSSWKQITNVKRNEDFNKLKSIQGIRVYNMFLIILLHTKLKILWMYLSNYEFVEQIHLVRAVQLIGFLDVFLVQTFFMISGLLLTIQIYTLIDRNKRITLWDVFIIIVNRFLRLAVASLVLILLLSSSYPRYFVGPHLMHFYLITQKACTRNWLATLLFYNNFDYVDNMCNPVTWYLAVDFQMYVIIAIVLYIIFKFKLNEWKTMGLITFASMIIYGASIYFLNLGVVFEPTIRNAEILNFVRSYTLWGNYSVTQSVWTTSFVGMILGAVYVKTKCISVKKSRVLTAIWLLCFAGLPIMALSMASNTNKGTLAPLIGPLVKPIFALGIGIGIIGMAHNLGGIVKKVCELKYILIVSNLTYCSYLCNMLALLSSHRSASSLIELTLINCLMDIVKDVVKCLCFGIILSVAVEQPGLALQKIWLPQVKKCKLKDDK